MTLGDRLRSSRKAASLSQAELAERMGVSVQAVSQWETDKNSPSTANLIALSAALFVSLAWLSSGSEQAEVAFTNIQRHPYLYRAPLLSMEEYFIAATGGADQLKPQVNLEITRSAGAPTFALTVEDDSMSPLFAPGDIILVDTYLYPEPGDFVCYIDRAAKTILFRLISFEESDKSVYITKLTPLNAHYANRTVTTQEPPGPNGDFCGTLIEHRRFRPSFKKSFREPASKS